MKFQNITVEKKGKVALVTLNRAEKLNVLNLETLKELHQAFAQIKTDRETHAVVVTGAGKAFAAGADISQMSPMNPAEAKTFALTGQRLFSFIESLPQVVIACLNGFALGGGCELACACDLRLMAKNGKIGEPEVNLGIIPGFAGSVRLPRLIGLSQAMKLILTGEAISAEEAHRIGLVHAVYDSHELLEQAMKLAAQLAEKPPLALAGAKKILREGIDHPFAEAEKREAEAFAECFTTRDQKEGMRAFLEKRPPRFEGK